MVVIYTPGNPLSSSLMPLSCYRHFVVADVESFDLQAQGAVKPILPYPHQKLSVVTFELGEVDLNAATLAIRVLGGSQTFHKGLLMVAD